MPPSSGWRTYQEKLQREKRIKRVKRKAMLIVGAVGGLMAVVFSGAWIGSRFDRPVSPPAPPAKLTPPQIETAPKKLTRHALSSFLIPSSGVGSRLTDEIVIDDKGSRFTLKTTVNPKLQSYVDALLERSKTIEAAVMVINPRDGRVLVMSGHDQNGVAAGVCLKADYPAASLFKIVSAAAALESAGYSPDKTLYFRGRRHTLYKNQLKQEHAGTTSKTLFRKAFAVSNNAVFGKLGIYVIGPQIMTEYAEKFYFNRPIPFDIPVAVSATEVPSDEYGLAEIASGFNKRTRLSPLHATMLACAVVNEGKMVAPWIIESVTDSSRTVLYEAERRDLAAAVSKQTAADLKLMMEDAVVYGTGRRTFRKLRRKKFFESFEFGLKTGTINDVTDKFKYDWVTAFAVETNTNNAICVGVVAVHGEKLGTRATELARAVIDYKFRS
jgi:cell division protein FtsI/penicillin-binding protein 2